MRILRESHYAGLNAQLSLLAPSSKASAPVPNAIQAAS